ncbi:tRNA uridine(34) 5-carboxymethylaminomethyl modification radical SAM/GNAT enzyme Elp3, partial [Candidatus Woesearchaeota archaeon]|nr:tRNA uridine(34) 5-carboxymethylaminomethyl modification radical SAM/GNAT enzyme Elp3 [Candidatus Woesearchaeota archaeon]
NILKFKEFFELPGLVGDKKRIDRIHQKLLALKGSSSLDEEKQKNESSKIRCIGLTIETKPDFGLLEHGNEMLDYGCTRVELGIQSVYEDVVKIVHRGHTVQDSINSMLILKDLGFKINAHYMPGLPLTNKERDINGFKELFSNPDFCPDMLKIYPCMVSKGTLLYQDFLNKKFTPLSTEDAAELIAEMKKFVPEYCRIQRIQRDVPTKFWDAGVGITNLRQYIHQKFKPQCRCIRCREPQGRIVDWSSVKIITQEYEASKGTEVFISAEDTKNDIILGFCRLRKPSQCLRQEITPSTAIIRELHVYGSAVGIGSEDAEKVQHKGLGKQLISEAERIAKERFSADKMLVISGIGVREYYRKLGYKNDGVYVGKQLN